MLRAGDIIGEYRVVGRLGAGGMGAVYIAQRTGAHGFARPVAIKVIDPSLADQRSVLDLFIREALLASRVDHPNVARVEQLAESDGVQLLVMEYVHGASLAQLEAKLGERGRRLAPALAVAIAIQAADGLHAAHEARDERGAALDLVHRDVSPQNVLVARSGHVKLIDFGVAKAVASQADHTRTGVLRGKLRYMAPEQAYGDEVDRRADVYALGIVLWELLTMRPAFHAANDFKLLDLVRQPALLPPSTYAPDVPPALDAVVMAALAPDRTRRIGTAYELRQRLVESLPDAQGVDPAKLGAMVIALISDESPAIDDASVRAQLETPVTGAFDGARVIESLTLATEPGTIADDDDVARRVVPAQAIEHASPPPRRGRMVLAAGLAVLLVASAVVAMQLRVRPAPALHAARPADTQPEVRDAEAVRLAVPDSAVAQSVEADDAGAVVRSHPRHTARRHGGSAGHTSTGGLPFASHPGF